MKYIITESKRDSAVFRYLDMKDYVQKKQKFIDHPGVKSSRLYFMHPSDEYADILYSYWNGRLIISGELHEEIMSFFIMDEIDAELVISEWVENKINKEIDVTQITIAYKTSISGELLKPDNWE